MAKGLVIKQIARRTGVVGIPRTTTMTGRVMIEEDENEKRVIRRVLADVKKRVSRDGKDRQIEFVRIKRLRGGRHRITSRVLYRVYKSHSDHLVYVYAGPAHQGPREDE